MAQMGVVGMECRGVSAKNLAQIFSLSPLPQALPYT